MALSDQVANVFQFHCIQCHAVLSVPPRAIGSRVRCPGCGQTMTVPESDAAFDESVSEWIAENVAELWDEEDEVIDERVDTIVTTEKQMPHPAAMQSEPTREESDALPVAEVAPSPHHAARTPRIHARVIRLFQ